MAEGSWQVPFEIDASHLPFTISHILQGTL
jgi:hypothetical protein